jgi:hypothetical protein
MAIQLPNDRTIISAKDPAETWLVYLDFEDVLVGKTVASGPVWSCARVSPASAPESILVGVPVNDFAPVYKHRVTGGTPGSLYRVSALLTTTLGEVIVGVLYLPVIDK